MWSTSSLPASAPRPPLSRAWRTATAEHRRQRPTRSESACDTRRPALAGGALNLGGPIYGLLSALSWGTGDFCGGLDQPLLEHLRGHPRRAKRVGLIGGARASPLLSRRARLVGRLDLLGGACRSGGRDRPRRLLLRAVARHDGRRRAAVGADRRGLPVVIGLSSGEYDRRQSRPGHGPRARRRGAHLAAGRRAHHGRATPRSHRPASAAVRAHRRPRLRPVLRLPQPRGTATARRGGRSSSSASSGLPSLCRRAGRAASRARGRDAGRDGSTSSWACPGCAPAPCRWRSCSPSSSSRGTRRPGRQRLFRPGRSRRRAVASRSFCLRSIRSSPRCSPRCSCASGSGRCRSSASFSRR